MASTFIIEQVPQSASSNFFTMQNYKDHLIPSGTSIQRALKQLELLAADAILFVVDESGGLLGSLTDGDVRRGLIKGLGLESKIDEYLQPNPKFIQKSDYSLADIIELRKRHFKIIPVLNGDNKVVNVINFRYLRSYLPLDAVIMAGGRGSRLQPMTNSTPKPLLKIGGTPIIEHNIDRLVQFGVDDFWISLRYLGEQVEAYLGDGSQKCVNIQYIWEETALGTIGAVSKIHEFQHEYVLVTNSDILTTLDYEDFFLDFLDKEADMAVATIPYAVDVPYAVLETANHRVLSFKEKPTYTYYSNAGIYLIKREMLEHIPKNSFYNSTDLMQQLITLGKRLISYPMRQYWLDIGKHEDFERAQEDIKHLDL